MQLAGSILDGADTVTLYLGRTGCYELKLISFYFPKTV